MRFTAKCISEEDQYIIGNYGKLPNELIALGLDITPNVVRRRAAYLREKGEPVARYSIIYWKKNENKKSKLIKIYGTRPTHRTAKALGTTIQSIHRAAARTGLHFRGNDGRYTFLELAQTIKIDETTIRRWINFGLKISGFARDGCTNPRTPRDEDAPTKQSHALIDLRDLKKFLKLRPEAYDLSKLDGEAKHLLGLTSLKSRWKEKNCSAKDAYAISGLNFTL